MVPECGAMILVDNTVVLIGDTTLLFISLRMLLIDISDVLVLVTMLTDGTGTLSDNVSEGEVMVRGLAMDFTAAVGA